jgi:pyruvate kinase
MQLIAKCETRQSLFNFKAIAQEADAIMLSRGNLGLDVLPEKMALVQKHVIQQCNMLGKPAIVTRVVDTMVSSPRPTRYSIFPLSTQQSSVKTHVQTWCGASCDSLDILA